MGWPRKPLISIRIASVMRRSCVPHVAQSALRVNTPDAKKAGWECCAIVLPTMRGHSGSRISSRCGSARPICFLNRVGRSFPISSTVSAPQRGLLNSRESLSLAHCTVAGKWLEMSPDPLITEGNSSLDGSADLPEPANTACGSRWRGSRRAQLVHPLGAELQACRTDAQRAQTFPDRISLAVRP